MKTNLIKIGNSKGIRIPKNLLQKAQISDEVEIICIDHNIIISPSKKEVRKDWDKMFANNPVDDEPELKSFREIANEFDEKEWEW